MAKGTIVFKTPDEIELIRISSLLVGKTLAEVASEIKPGVTTKRLDEIAETYIRDNGGVPSFKGYQGFKASLCISINEAVVHGIPGNREIREEDILSIDCGVFKNGFHGDSAFTFAVAVSDEAKLKLLRITRESLLIGVAKARAGFRVGDISAVVQEHAEQNGYGVVRELVGHGVGRELHEKPEVPNYGKRGSGALLKPGMTIAIEPMINMGTRNVKQLNDGWTVVTRDAKPSAHFEHTIAITNEEANVLSSFKDIDEAVSKNEYLKHTLILSE